MRKLPVLLLALAFVACPKRKTPDPPPAPTFDWYVDAVNGSDANAGTADAPFKTITFAMTTAAAGQSVKVAPGTYDAANGETFPIALPASVSLIGDEENKGGGSSFTRILGGGNNVDGFGTAVDAGANAVIAGFAITNNNTGLATPMNLTLRNNAITVRNNRIYGSSIVGILANNGSINHVITGNVIIDNDFGLFFDGGGAGSRIEGNEIRHNRIGVEYDSAGGDLGGGAAGSAGGNILSSNRRADLWTDQAITIDAQNNFWDHATPTVETNAANDTNFAGNDIFNDGTIATIVTTGAQLASDPNP